MYRITLTNNMMNRQAVALYAVYSFDEGALSWPLNPVGNYHDRAVIVATCPHNLMDQRGVKSRVLRARYDHEPRSVEYAISSVLEDNYEHSASDSNITLTDAKETTMTQYATTINMSAATANALSQGKFWLYGFKAVKGGGSGRPLVWFATQTYSTNTSLQWEETYYAYTSLTASIAPNTKITASNIYKVDLGDTLNVMHSDGVGQPVRSGTPDVISIVNQTTTQFTCGLAQTDPTGATALMCAFTLYGENTDEIAPIEKILLMFATKQVNTGTVIEQAFGPGMSIDLTGAPPVNGIPTRSVNYDINTQWSWDNSEWGETVSSNSNILPFLINNS
jgi:hypothetical protein